MAEIKNGLSIEFISHPGDTLFELLQQYGISQKELSIKTQTSEKHINEIINGKKSITVSFAKKLENVFKPSASFWINRQNIYDERIESIRVIENISQEEKDIVSLFPVQELSKYGYIKAGRNIVENVLSLRKFAATSNLLETPNVLNYMLAGVSFKKDKTSSKSNDYKLYSWLRMCQIETESTYNPNNYDEKKLKESLPKIKELSLLEDFSIAYERLISILYECGINFKIVKNFKSLPVQGFIKTVNNNVSLCTTIKWHREDVFWFTLFHEIGHLLSKRNSYAFIDFQDDEEAKANNFARDYLVSTTSYSELEQNISERSIKRCAKTNNVCPAIVVGRLEKEKKILPNQYKYLIRQIVFAE